MVRKRKQLTIGKEKSNLLLENENLKLKLELEKMKNKKLLKEGVMSDTQSILNDVEEFDGTMRMAKQIVTDFNSLSIDEQLDIGGEIQVELANWAREMRNRGVMTNRNETAINYIDEHLGE